MTPKPSKPQNQTDRNRSGDSDQLGLEYPTLIACPTCKGRIPVTAVVCRHCLASLQGENGQKFSDTTRTIHDQGRKS